MTSERTLTDKKQVANEAVVWIDYDWAVIVEQGPGCRDRVELLDRRPAESTEGFEARTVDEVIDKQRVLVSGPEYARTTFERAYVSMTHRPDRLVDIEPTTSTTPDPKLVTTRATRS